MCYFNFRNPDNAMDIIVSRVWGYIFKNIHAMLTLIILKFPSLPDDIRMELGNTVSANCNKKLLRESSRISFPSLPTYYVLYLDAIENL